MVGNPQNVNLGAVAMYACLGHHGHMKRTAFFLREDQIQKLEALSEKTMAPVAAIIRKAIDEYLKREGK